MDTSIGERIRARRKELHITGVQIKELTGISTGNLSEIENGKILPSSTALIHLSQVLDCSSDYILFGKSSKNEITGSSSELTDSEQEFLHLFRALSEDDREELQMMAHLKYNRAQKKRTQKKKSSPSATDRSDAETA